MRRHGTRARVTYHRLSKFWGEELKCLDTLDDALKEEAKEIMRSTFACCFHHLEAMSVNIPFVIRNEVYRRVQRTILGQILEN